MMRPAMSTVLLLATISSLAAGCYARDRGVVDVHEGHRPDDRHWDNHRDDHHDDHHDEHHDDHHDDHPH